MDIIIASLSASIGHILYSVGIIYGRTHELYSTEDIQADIERNL